MFDAANEVYLNLSDGEEDEDYGDDDDNENYNDDDDGGVGSVEGASNQ